MGLTRRCHCVDCVVFMIDDFKIYEDVEKRFVNIQIEIKNTERENTERRRMRRGINEDK